MPTRPQALFQVVIRRHSGFYIWKIFLPMILMASIPWAVFWYEVHDFSGQMSVPLAVMLSMVAFQLSIAKDLPRVGYTTFLDAVFLTSFTFCIPVHCGNCVRVRAAGEKADRPGGNHPAHCPLGFPARLCRMSGNAGRCVLAGRTAWPHEEGK